MTIVTTSSYQCNPALHRRGGDTCLPLTALERMRRIWNKTHPRNKIVMPSQTRKAGANAGKQAGYARKLWDELRKAMKSHYKCETEYCMVKKLPGLSTEDKSGLLSYFRPEKPTQWDKKPTQWLDSYNIEDVMNQYEQADKAFEFIGPVPIDFDTKLGGGWGKCVSEELCKLNLPVMASKGKNKVGIIYNLDPHDEPGSHWVCSYVDIPGKKAYYFDSYGYEPPEEVERFLKRCKDQGCTEIYYNDVRHQRKGSECGMYCLYTLICLLRGKSFYDICKNIVDDDKMNAFRDILFAEETPRRDAIEKALPTLCL